MPRRRWFPSTSVGGGGIEGENGSLGVRVVGEINQDWRRSLGMEAEDRGGQSQKTSALDGHHRDITPSDVMFITCSSSGYIMVEIGQSLSKLKWICACTYTHRRTRAHSVYL